MASEFILIAMAQLWQVTLLILLVAALNRWLSLRRPHLSHLLWLVVLIKCVTPPLWASSSGVFCWLQPEHRVDTSLVENVELTSVPWNEFLEVDVAGDPDFDVNSAPFAGVYLDESAERQLLETELVARSASSEQPESWIDESAVSVWLLISGLVLLGVTIRWLRFWKLVRMAGRRDSAELTAMLQTLSKQLGVRRRVRLIVTESLVGPAVIGFFRVTVLIPTVVADKLKGESVAPILAHELLHVRRGDLWVGFLQTIAQALWWFHPLVWWVGRATSREAERCCDEEVLGELKCDPACYARALLDVLDLKSQLKPVPVFPGVRPVDVTSQRLERIMTLRQGCRRRTPWWCWLVAIGAAVLTLPGAAFVVTAQDEKFLEPTNEKPEELLDQPAFVGPGPHPPLSIPTETPLSAFTIGASSGAPTTRVYDIAEFATLLSANKSETRDRFERLVRSRHAAHKAQINWFNNQPVVKTTAAGHAAIRQCVDVLVGGRATSETVDEFLESVSRLADATLICDLQVISVSDDAYSKLEDVAIEHAKGESWVIPAKKWDEAFKSINREEKFHFLAPQCASFNGRNVMVESIGERPVGLERADDGSLIPGRNWSGWKMQLLPFVRHDDSFWLGVAFEKGKVVGTKELNPQEAKQVGAEGAATIHSYEKIQFSTSLKDGEVFVLPGFEIAYGDGEPRATLMTARVRRIPNKPSPDAVGFPQPLLGAGVKSDAGVSGTIQLDAQPEKQTSIRKKTSIKQASASALDLPPGTRESKVADEDMLLTRRRFGLLTFDILHRGDPAKSPEISIQIKTTTGQEVLAGTADDVRIRATTVSETFHLEGAKLLRKGESPAEIVAERLAIEVLRTDDEALAGRLALTIEDGEVRIRTGSEFSDIKAERIEVILNSAPFRVDEMSAEGLGSLRTTRPDLQEQNQDVSRSKSESSSQENATRKPESQESVLRRRARESGKSLAAVRSSIVLETRVSPQFTEVLECPHFLYHGL